MERLQVLSFETPDLLAETAARHWLDQIRIRDRAHVYGVALAGGRIVKLFYDAIASAARNDPGLFDNVHFFWGDERCVPPSDPESNFAVAQKHLFGPLGIATEQIHRILGETDDAYAAKEAEAELCRLMPLDPSGQPILDQVFLGMGEDGHIASLFPQEPSEMIEDARVYRPVTATKPPPKRITIGYPALRAARQTWILASGSGKDRALNSLLSGDLNLPVTRLVQLREETRLFEDISVRKII